jgi:UDP-4-amino-4,6-dideoxy-N-acetyl-beta-L-altrosamine transaminase
MIPYGKQDISQDDIEAVLKVLKSDYLTQGPTIPLFEQALKEYCNANYSVVMNSATSCLHLACLALGLGKDDIVWTSPITFVASANCAIYCGAEVDFVDIDIETNNMSILSLEEKLKSAKDINKLPSIVIPVHMCGLSCDMESIYNLSKKYGFKVVEDASHAIGASYKSFKVGSCEYSDITVFSFHPVKIITSGEGGALLTNNKELSEKIRILRSHGVTRDQGFMDKPPDGDWYYQQISLGFNYRMTDIQAALGLSQISRIDEFVEKRNTIAEIYKFNLNNLELSLPVTIDNTYSSFHLFVIKLKEQAKIDRKSLFDFLRTNNVGVNVHYIPVHTQPFYRDMGFSDGDFPVSEDYYTKALSIPIFPELQSEDQNHIIKKINEALT